MSRRRLALWLGFALGLVCLIALYLYGRAYDDDPSIKQSYQRRYVEVLLDYHRAWQDDDLGLDRILTGFWSAQDVEHEVERLYRDVTDPFSLTDFALVLHSWGRQEEALGILRDLEVTGTDLEPYVTSLRSLLSDTVSSETDLSWMSPDGSWWSLYIWQLAEGNLSTDGFVVRRGWAQAAMVVGYWSLLFWLATLIFAPRIFQLVRRRRREEVYWHPGSSLKTMTLAVWGAIVALVIVWIAGVLGWGGWTVSGYRHLQVFSSLTIGIIPILILMIGTSARAGVSSWSSKLGMDWKHFVRWKTWRSVLGLYPCMVLFAWGQYYLGLFFGVSMDLGDWMGVGLIDSDTAGLAVNMFASAIVAPVSEEIFFRGLLFAGLCSRLSVWKSAILSTLLFTILHTYSLWGLISIFVFGMIMCWLYIKTGTLWACILFHALTNFVYVCQIWYPYSYR